MLASVHTPDASFLGPACCLDINLEAQPYHCLVSGAQSLLREKACGIRKPRGMYLQPYFGAPARHHPLVFSVCNDSHHTKYSTLKAAV